MGRNVLENKLERRASYKKFTRNVINSHTAVQEPFSFK